MLKNVYWFTKDKMDQPKTVCSDTQSWCEFNHCKITLSAVRCCNAQSVGDLSGY